MHFSSDHYRMHSQFVLVSVCLHLILFIYIIKGDSCHPENEYECPGTNDVCRCKNIHTLCDGIQDCSGGEDEDLEFCQSQCKQLFGWWCTKYSKCIHRTSMCDGSRSCTKKSDKPNVCREVSCPSNLGYVKCEGSEQCVHVQNVCEDEMSPCSNGWQPATSSGLCSTDQPFTGHCNRTLENSCYEIVTERKTWYNASQYCRQQGGHLAIVDTEEEHQFLINISLEFRSHFWLDGSDIQIEDYWVWNSTNNSISFDGWIPGYPIYDDWGNCLFLSFVAQAWADWICTANMYSLCEYSLPDAESTATSCAELLSEGNTQSGVYTIDVPMYGSGPAQTTQMDVYCDMNTNGGGWTVFQRRQDGSVNFTRLWEEYAVGFGNLNGEFWLGNRNLALLLNGTQQYELRVDMADSNDEQRYAEYNVFYVEDETANFQLTVHGYTGNAGDAMWLHNGTEFSTPDRDNDGPHNTCAQSSGAGFWFSFNCGYARLNNPYIVGADDPGWVGIMWYPWQNEYGLKFSEMKIRPWSGATTT